MKYYVAGIVIFIGTLHINHWREVSLVVLETVLRSQQQNFCWFWWKQNWSHAQPLASEN